MKTILPLVILICLSVSLNAQNTGYLGKKFLIKTNVVNGKLLGFNNVDLEYVAGRRTSLFVSGQHFSYQVRSKGITKKTGTLKPGNNRGTVAEYSTLRDGVTTGNIISGGIRHYFDVIMPAPYGFYIDASVGLGSANLEDFRVTYTLNEVQAHYQIYPKPDSQVLSGTTSILFAELPALGYQHIFRCGITIDTRVAMQFQYCRLPDELLNAFDRNYFVRTNTLTFERSGLAFGPAVFVKLGYLLF
ncbi:MAG: hypothetical protein V4635_18030 [Bacteroidota bacterium]